MQNFINDYKKNCYEQIEKKQIYLCAHPQNTKAINELNEYKFRLKILEQTQKAIEEIDVEPDFLKAFDLCIELYRKICNAVSGNKESLNKVREVRDKANKDNLKKCTEKIKNQLESACEAYENEEYEVFKGCLENLCCAFLYDFHVTRTLFTQGV